jgi:hypothetical protein
MFPPAVCGQELPSKLDANGRELPADAAAWAMVKDPATGLIWEVKTTDGSIHDRTNSYSWKKHRKEFLDRLNEEKFGGFSDWRLPEESELQDLVRRDREPPRIDEKYFPHTAPAVYLGWSLCQDGSLNVAKVNFGPVPAAKTRTFAVRAVRGERPE